MPPLPDKACQATIYPTVLLNQPGCRSISDDDLCAWYMHLCYRPGERSLSRLTADGVWPSRCDVDGYAQSCPQLLLNVSSADVTYRITSLTRKVPAQRDHIHAPYKEQPMNNITDLQTLSGTENASTLTATLLSDEHRIGFWLEHFGSIPQWITLEPHIFAWMDRLCTEYSGGVWRFYKLSNDGAFMAPEPDGNNDEKWTLFNPMNGNSEVMSAEAAGIAVCLMTYSHHACHTESDTMTEHYYRLRDYALRHAECSAIMNIID